MTVYPEMIDPTRPTCVGELLEEALATFKTETALIEVDRSRLVVPVDALELTSPEAGLVGALGN